MKKIVLMLVLAMTVATMGCKKVDEKETTVEPKVITHSLKIVSHSEYAYLVEVYGRFQQVEPYKSITFKLEKGNYTVKATQQEGYIFYPTVLEVDINLSKDKELTIPSN